MFVNGRDRERERVRGRCKYDLRTHRVRVYERVQVWMGIYERESMCECDLVYECSNSFIKNVCTDERRMETMR